MKYSKIDGMLAWSGGNTLLKQGDSIDDDHPLLAERPDLFGDEEPEAKRVTPGAPVIERGTSAPGEVRVTPATGPRGNRVPKVAGQ